MKQITQRKKYFYMMQSVKDFMREQSGEIKQELNSIVWRLETEGSLTMPYGEKVTGEQDLFAIRIIQAGNVRVFYVYGLNDIVYGIHAYTKKTQAIPQEHKQQALKVVKVLTAGGLIK